MAEAQPDVSAGSEGQASDAGAQPQGGQGGGEGSRGLLHDEKHENAGTVLDAAKEPEPEAPKVPDWAEGLTEKQRGRLEAKGWKSPGDVIDSQYELEKHLGLPADRLLKLPAEGAEASEWDAFYAKLGRPENADGYDFSKATPVQEGLNDISGHFKEIALKGNLTKAQAETVLGSLNELLNYGHEQAVKQAQEQSDRDVETLRAQWGEAFEPNITAGKRWLNRMEVTNEQRDAMEDAMGTAAFLTFAAKMGRMLGEHRMPNDGDLDSGADWSMGATPAGIDARIEQLKSDPDFVSRYNRGEPAAVKQMQDLIDRRYR